MTIRLPANVTQFKKHVRDFDYRLVENKLYPNQPIPDHQSCWRRVGLVQTNCFTLKTKKPDGSIVGSYIDFPPGKEYKTDKHVSDPELGFIVLGGMTYEVRKADPKLAAEF